MDHYINQLSSRPTLKKTAKTGSSPRNWKSHDLPSAPAYITETDPADGPSSKPKGLVNDQDFELANVGNEVCTKIKGNLLINYKIKGASTDDWNLVKLICAMTVFEIYHNVNVPIEYLATLVSALFRTCKKGKFTSVKSSGSNLLWGTELFKWVTGSCIVPFAYKNHSCNVNHMFPMVASSSSIIHVTYSVTFSQDPYVMKDVLHLLEDGYKYIETLFAKLECREETLFMIKIRREHAVFSYDAVLKSFSKHPSIMTGKTETQLQTWDLTPIKRYRHRSLLQTMTSKKSSQSLIPSLPKDEVHQNIPALPWK